MIELIDTHTHLDSSQFDEDREEVISRAKAAGVTRMINVGASSGYESNQKSQELAEKYDHIWFTSGIHPHDSDRELDIEQIRKFAKHPKSVAVGETGLDFFRDWAPKDKQYEWFEAQIVLALELNKPIIIHSRETAEECYQVLKRMNAEKVGGVFHCYGETAEFAKKLFDINFIVSIPGIVSFKNAKNIHEAVKHIPLERMMVETDAPYLAPTPHRGKRCEPAYVVRTAQAIAEIKEISYEKVAEVTTNTALNFFGIS
ncbi:MAG: TatD family hydrolase [Bdellovibrionota bacterium]